VLLALVAVLATGVLLWLPFYYPPETNRIFMQVMFLAIAALGLNLLTGYNGQVSIGHGAFFGVGAFTTGLLMTKQGWSYEATIPVAAVVAALVGILVGFPALRVRGLYLALVTLGLAVLFPSLVSKWVHGEGGVALLRPETRQFASLLNGLDDDQWQYYETLVITVGLFLLAWNLIRSRMGRAMVAVRDQELAASAMGVNVAWVKVGTFSLSAAYAGIAGSLSVMVNHLADGTNPILYFQLSIEFLVAVVIGGSGTILGPAVGAMVLVFIQRPSSRRPSSAPRSSSSCSSCPKVWSGASRSSGAGSPSASGPDRRRPTPPAPPNPPSNPRPSPRPTLSPNSQLPRRSHAPSSNPACRRARAHGRPGGGRVQQQAQRHVELHHRGRVLRRERDHRHLQLSGKPDGRRER
jgi:branched-chain amino acid transport system permease protein